MHNIAIATFKKKFLHPESRLSLLTLDKIYRMPKAIAASTLKCSGNRRPLLEQKANGNPWTVGGAGLAMMPRHSYGVRQNGLRSLVRRGMEVIESFDVRKISTASLLEPSGLPFGLLANLYLQSMTFGKGWCLSTTGSLASNKKPCLS